MKPLGNWLTECSSSAALSYSCPEVEPQEFLVSAVESEGKREIDFKDRELELLLALRQAEERLNSAAETHAEAESRLRQTLGAELGDRLVSEIGSALESLLATLEDCLFQVLVPFLSERARTRAASDLVDLIRDELRKADLPVLEIRAPSILHGALNVMGEKAAVSVKLVEADVTEIVFSTHPLQFEDLSSRWCKSIEGKET
jgi:hypothetical protein